MIPSGLHFVYWSSVSKEGSVGPRTGFFHYFAQKEIVAKRFNTEIEAFEDSFTEEDLERFRSNLKVRVNYSYHLKYYTVCLIVLNQGAPCFMPKSTKKRPKFFFQKAPQFWSKAPQFETFSTWHEVENDPPCHFYYIFMQQFFPRATQN